MRNLIRCAERPENLYGIDLFPRYVHEAHYLSPNMHFAEASATELSYNDESFDICMHFTVLTSVLDRAIKQSIGSEMRRVTHPSAIIIWYDFFFDNPSNGDVKGVR